MSINGRWVVYFINPFVPGQGRKQSGSITFLEDGTFIHSGNMFREGYIRTEYVLDSDNLIMRSQYDPSPEHEGLAEGWVDELIYTLVDQQPDRIVAENEEGSVIVELVRRHEN